MTQHKPSLIAIFINCYLPVNQMYHYRARSKTTAADSFVTVKDVFRKSENELHAIDFYTGKPQDIKHKENGHLTYSGGKAVGEIRLDLLSQLEYAAQSAISGALENDHVPVLKKYK